MTCCDICGEESDAFDMGIMTSPLQSGGTCERWHICRKCFHLFTSWVAESRENPPPEQEQPEQPTFKGFDDTEYRLSEKIRTTFKCPKCGSPMKLRKNKSNGSMFAGCTKFPECRGTREQDGSVGGRGGGGGGGSPSQWRAPDERRVSRYSPGFAEDGNDDGWSDFDADDVPF